MSRFLLALLATLPLAAGPVWKAPKTAPYGQLTVLELTEEDPTKPPLPRPGDDKLGPLMLRAVEATKDGRGWRLTVQPLVPGINRIPPLDLGDGRRTPELRLEVPRTTPYGAPWMGVGGGQEDVLPAAPFPVLWSTLLLLPFVALGWLILRLRRKGAPKRRRGQARRRFAQAWPPRGTGREALDASHAAGRDLLATTFGEAARSWGAPQLRHEGLHAWGRWCESLDAARFGRTEPPFPEREALLKELGP